MKPLRDPKTLVVLACFQSSGIYRTHGIGDVGASDVQWNAGSVHSWTNV